MIGPVVAPWVRRYAPPPACTYRTCELEATHKLIPPRGAPWFGCNEHYAAMGDALGVGEGQAGVDIVTRADLR